jgi:hypothetical protein
MKLLIEQETAQGLGDRHFSDVRIRCDFATARTGLIYPIALVAPQVARTVIFGDPRVTMKPNFANRDASGRDLTRTLNWEN